MTIGLFGGSFDPAHAGHLHVADTALKRLGLDAVWWLVTPQNPLKAQSRPLSDRLASAAGVARGRKHVVTAMETALGVGFTYQTLEALQRRYPGVRFVFVMGADGMDSFRRWRQWRQILARMPVFVVSRPLAGPRARFALPFPAHARRAADHRLPFGRLPTWAFWPARLHAHSSTAFRRRG
jgi:nicotinate-nucleotide adenylyltransferase